MDKPITVICEDLISEIQTAVQKSNLSPYLLKLIFGSLYNEIDLLSQQQIFKERTDYNKTQNQEATK